MKIKDSYILREVAGMYVVIATGNEALDFSNVITINELGAFIWKKIEEGKNQEEIVQDILSEYSIDKETAENDCKAFIGQLKEINIICD